MRNLDYIWSINERKLDSTRRWLLRTLKRCIIAIDCITKNNIMSYASALTYSSMLAAVPVLAIIFAIGRGFGFDTLIEGKIRESLDASPEIADTIISFVDSYLQHTHGGVFIGIGLIFLLYTLLSLTTNIETAFNTIWHVPSSRNVYRQITDYISVFLLLPFAIVILSGINIILITFRSQLTDYQIISNTLAWVLQISPIVFTCIAFVLLYKLMPNTKVHIRNTIGPGILAGITFMMTEYLYVHYQIKLSAYNAIYGSFAALPLFMLWLQISWCICLVGGQLSYANQCLDGYAFERYSDDISRRYNDTLMLLLLTRICKRFATGEKPYTCHSLVRDTRLPETLVHSMLNELVNMQLLAETFDANGMTVYYLPAVDVHQMTISMVMRRIDRQGMENPSRNWQMSTPEWAQLRTLRNKNQDALLIEI